MVQKTRTDLLNFLAEKYSLEHYLEIGVQLPELNFDRIKIRHKISVDPDPESRAIFCETSDQFFAHWKPVETIEVTSRDSKEREFLRSDQRFDLIFIDGLHTAEQVMKDFENALKVLSPNGFIVLHDLLPETYERTIVPRPTPRGSWNGDCYKFAVKLYKEKNFRVVNIDNGCGVLQGNRADVAWSTEIEWDEFQEDRNLLYNIISWEEFCKLYDGRILERH